MATRVTLTHRDDEHAVQVLDDGTVDIDGRRLALTRRSDGSLAIAGDTGYGRSRAWAVPDGDRVWVQHDGCVYVFERQAPGWAGGSSRRQDLLSAPMPASVRQVLVEPGQAVARGDVLILLEAMKMELPIRAGGDGVVRAVHCRPGDLVQPGVPLLDLDDR